MAVIKNVNPSEMLTVAGEMDGKINEWDALVKKIFTLQGELDAMWDGDANNAFNNRWLNEDKPKYDTLKQVMLEWKEAIITAANLYIEKEGDIVGIINTH